MEILKKEFSTRLKKSMELRKIPQSKLSLITKINKGTVSAYVNGRFIPKSQRIGKLAKALMVSPTWLMGLTNDDCPPELIIEQTKINLKDIEKNNLINEIICKCNDLSIDDFILVSMDLGYPRSLDPFIYYFFKVSCKDLFM